MVTQKEIAKKAGLSRATVSRAFTQNANISPQTMAKLQAAMTELGLQPLAWFPGAGGAKKRSNYVLVIAGDISNHFYSKIIRGISCRLAEQGLLAVVCDSGLDLRREIQQIEFAAANDYLGVILITASEQPALIDVLRRVKLPVILVNRYIHSLETDVVCIDNYTGGYVAASYLIEKGHSRIAHVASIKGSTPQEDRIRGFSDALKDLHTAPYQYEVFYGEQTVGRGRQFAEELVRGNMPYTALFVTDCQIAVGIVNYMNQHDFQIPRDLSILCFDDSPYIDEYGLSLSTVRYDPFSMGQATVDTLINRLSHPSDEKYYVQLVPQLIDRSSILAL